MGKETFGPFTRDDITKVSVAYSGFSFLVPIPGDVLITTKDSNLVFGILHGKKFKVKANPKRIHPMPEVYLVTEYWEEVKGALMYLYPEKEPDIDLFVEHLVSEGGTPERHVKQIVKDFRKFQEA